MNNSASSPPPSGNRSPGVTARRVTTSAASAPNIGLSATAACVAAVAKIVPVAIQPEHSSADVVRHVGSTFAANTCGAICGSLAGGFFLLPILTAPGAWQAVVWLLAGLAIANNISQHFGKFGNILDPDSEVAYILRHKRVYVLKEDVGTQPRFYYFFDK